MMTVTSCLHQTPEQCGSIWMGAFDANGPLGQRGGDQPDHAAPNLDHVCVLVQPWDTDSIKAQLQQHEVEIGDVASRYGATGMGPSMYLRGY